MLDKLRGFFSVAQPLAEQTIMTSEDLRLATAVILVACASTDRDFSASEYESIASLIQRHLKLSQIEVTKLIDAAATSENVSMLAQFVSEIREHLTPQQREQVLSCAWAVIFADGICSDSEKSFASELRHSLGLSLEQALRARKLAEGVTTDGFKDFLSSSEEVMQATKTWGEREKAAPKKSAS